MPGGVAAADIIVAEITGGVVAEQHVGNSVVVEIADADHAVCVSIITYSVRLETRVTTLEVCGSPHLAEINNRLTVLESQTQTNKASIDRITEIMLRELNKPN